ncbi:hypothetical protein Tco_0360265 [Tanacetum coccineum]
MIQNPDKPDDPTAKIIEPLSKMTESNKQRYFSYIRERIRRLMHGSEKTKQQRHLRLVDEFDKFVAVEGESLSSVYESLTTLVNNANIKETEFDHLFDTLSQYEPHVIASRAKKGTRNHDPLALVAYTNVHSSYSHASPSYSHSPQPYYVTHPSSVIDYEEDYQMDKQGDAQEDKLTTRMMEQMLLAMKDKAGGNLNEEENDFMLDNHYGDDSLEELNVAVIMMAHIQPTNDKFDAEQTSDANALGEVNASQIYLKSRMHSKSIHEHTNHVKLKTVIKTSDDDQIDSSIIFVDPYVKNNGIEDEHDSNSHDQSTTLESLIQNVQKEAKNQRSLNNELKKQKALLQKELEACKEWVKTLEKKPVKSWNYKEAYEELEQEMHVDKDKINNLIKEKDKIQDEFFQLENAAVRIRHETELSKKAFKA